MLSAVPAGRDVMALRYGATLSGHCATGATLSALPCGAGRQAAPGATRVRYEGKLLVCARPRAGGCAAARPSRRSVRSGGTELTAASGGEAELGADQVAASGHGA